MEYLEDTDEAKYLYELYMQDTLDDEPWDFSGYCEANVDTIMESMMDNRY